MARDAVTLTLVDYNEKRLTEKRIAFIDECFRYKNQKSVTWVHLDSLKNTTLLKSIGDGFGLHPLVLENILDADQRAKIEDYGDYLFLNFSGFAFDKAKRFLTTPISAVFGPKFVITFQEGGEDFFAPVREQIRNAKSRIRKEGPDYLVYAMLDALVDQYFTLVDQLEENVELLEDRLTRTSSQKSLQNLHTLKRQLTHLRRAVAPLRDVLSNLERGSTRIIKKSTIVYMRDVYEHMIHLIETIETLRESLSGALDVYLSRESARTNEIMKVLTVISTVFIPLTFITGVYGMNFHFMPEIPSVYGYPAALLLMLSIGGFMLLYFHRKKWV
ncbi:MAG: magnesium/cobalt transporter CorA [Nanoarchaeota archaeon]|nr:magnesium/cobalt transporter CorA [Nanoarchaeota archaeon]